MTSEAPKDSFYGLGADEVLNALEAIGLSCLPVCFPLNSFENRVYEIELEATEETEDLHAIHRKRVLKFYRPGRWTKGQIEEEHAFLQDLVEAEVPVIAPLKIQGKTLHTMENEEIYFTVFPKVGGRIPQEPDEEQYLQIGRLIARLHGVGRKRESKLRRTISVESYGQEPLEFLKNGDWIPKEFESRYIGVAEEIFERSVKPLASIKFQRIHGDCHFGNLLTMGETIHFLDFDDMLVGPPVQDLWLLSPDVDIQHSESWSLLLEGYEQMGSFDRSSLSLVESLRALRMIHFTGWLAKRWADPAFPRAFPYFNSIRYWNDQTRDLEEQSGRVKRALEG